MRKRTTLSQRYGGGVDFEPARLDFVPSEIEAVARSREPMDFDLEVLKAVASQHESGGAAEPVIREAVDFYERIFLSPTELGGALARLEDRGLVRQHSGRYLLTEAALPAVPRTRGGRISMGRVAWNRVGPRLLGPVAPDG